MSSASAGLREAVVGVALTPPLLADGPTSFQDQEEPSQVPRFRKISSMPVVIASCQATKIPPAPSTFTQGADDAEKGVPLTLSIALQARADALQVRTRTSAAEVS